MSAERLQSLSVIGRCRPGLCPGKHGALPQGQGVVRDDELVLEGKCRSQTVAGRTGPEGIVEGKQPGLDFGDGEAGNGTGEFLRKDEALVGFVLVLQNRAGGGHFHRPVGEFRDRDAVSEPQGCFKGVRQAPGDVLAHHDPVHDHVDVMLVLLVEGGGFGDFVEFAVDLDPLEALFHELGEFLAVFALSTADDRRQQVETGAFLKLKDPVDHLGHGLALDRQTGRRRIGNADPREQKAHVVVDLGHRPDRGSRIPGSGLLFDGNGRRQAVDLVDIRFLHHFQELARIGRQAFHIAALALGIDRVERKRRLARS